jgi:hypothetical protein
MSGPLASYAFLPWLRRGLAGGIQRQDGDMTGDPRASVPLVLTLNADGQARDVPVPLALYGPGEILGIDRRNVVRTIPKSGEIDADPNYFVVAEFDQADFPWRYTAASAASTDRLRPWLVLAVLRAEEISDEAPPSTDRLAAITVASAAALPRLSQSWAWAHAQVEGFDPANEAIEDVVRLQPWRVRSRLLAPRRLTPSTAYRAMLVPTFERGRRAGLGDPLDEQLDALTLAWAEDSQNIRLPIYYEWRFQTGSKGDFEDLARRLVARPVDDGLGRIDMDVTLPDPALPSAALEPLAYEGALVSPKMTSSEWPESERGPFVTALAKLLNQPADGLLAGGDPIVAPPLWVRWQAATDRLDPHPGAEPRWFHLLNSDPRNRAAAGLGAEAVRRNDQSLMAAAWDQVEGVNAANAELRRAQLAREAASRLHSKHFGVLKADTFLSITRPLHRRFTASLVTIASLLRQSPIPHGALDAQFRRVTRPRGAIAKRVAEVGTPTSGTLLERLNSGALRARPPLKTPAGLFSPARLNASVTAPTHPPPAHPSHPPAAPPHSGSGPATHLTPEVLARLKRDREALQRGTISAAAIKRALPTADFVPAASSLESGHRPVPPSGLTPRARTKSLNALRAAFADVAQAFEPALLPGPELQPVDLQQLSQTLFEKMDPRLTIPAAIIHRLEIADWVRWDYDDPLEPIMAAPEFDAPMYEPLRDTGQIWLMPGIGTIPPDTITLVASNQRFIEAYMAGLSHEMARELLYHEYPTDQRGTYFRQFWDVRGAAPLAGGSLKDIKAIPEWGRDVDLGANSGRSPSVKPGNLVFLVKGDLLRRFPTTMVYAVRTIITNGERTLGDEMLDPIFEGRLSPDISFFGFNLVADDVRGHDNPAEDQGWYFMFQERPGEPMFGLDSDDGHYGGQPASWLDLNWANLAADAPSLQSLGYIDLDAQLPDTSQVVPAPADPPLAWHATQGLGPAGANSSDLAYVTLQRPFRVAIHGSDMLAAQAS